MTTIKELKEELAEQRKKVSEAQERRKLKFQIAVAKSPVKRNLIAIAKATGKGIKLGAKKLQSEGERRQKIQSLPQKGIKKGKCKRKSISDNVFQPLDF